MTRPAFALVGAVNHGKSSIAATLVERDDIGVSSDPGMTRVNQKLEHRAHDFCIWDTPGFQDPRTMLAEVGEGLADSRDPLSYYQHFARQYEGTKKFEAEREVCKVLCEEAAILYVIDSSKPLTKLHEAEMELLMLTGLPRLAILNTTGEPEHEAEWRARLGQRFGVVTVFNAHKATARDRVGLIRTMATVVDKWRASLQAIADEMEADWTARMEESAHIIVELLVKSLRHSRSAYVAPGHEKGSIIESEKEHLHNDLRKQESSVHKSLRKLFCHDKVAFVSSTSLAVSDDLFSSETWQLFGLPWWALLSVGAGGGATAGALTGVQIGAVGEVALPSGLPTAFAALTGGAIGGIIGGTTSFYVGKSIAQPYVKEEAAKEDVVSKLKSAGEQAISAATGTGTVVTIGPLKGDNFAYVLLDRAMGVVLFFSQRTHARRDQESLDASQMKGKLDSLKASTEHWPAKISSCFSKFLKKVRNNKETEADIAAFEEELAKHIGSFVHGVAPAPANADTATELEHPPN